jgi:putative transposase
MTSEEQLLRKLEIIEPLLQLSPVPWEAIKKQAAIAQCSPKTINRWLKAFREQGTEGLKGKTTSKRNSIHSHWKAFITNKYLGPKRFSVAFVQGLCVQKANEEGIKPPSYSTVYRVIQKIPNSTKAYYRHRKTYKDKYQVSGDLNRATYPGEVYLIDHRKVDILILEEKRNRQKAKRPWITCVMDQYSRTIVGYYLGFDPPSSRRVALSLRHAILPKNDLNWPMCGIPTKMKHDHGKDLVSNHIKQVRLDLKIGYLGKEIGNPRGNAIIERFFKTMADWENQWDGWVGNSLKNRPDHVKPSLSLNQFDQLFGRFIYDYHHKKHSSIKMTPIDRWNQGGLPRLPETEKELDLMLMPFARSYKVRRTGIHFLTNRYWCDELLEFIGETASIRYDPFRLDEIIVFVGNKRIGNAINLGEKIQNYQEYRKKRSEQNRLMKAYKTGNTPRSDKKAESEKYHQSINSNKERSTTAESYIKNLSKKNTEKNDINPLPIKNDDTDWC